MTLSDDLNRAQGAVRDLQRAVAGLRVHLGSNIDIQRLADDVERCSADLTRLREHTPTTGPAGDQPLVVIPDQEYDASLWADGDVDAEGIGVPGRRAP